MCEATLLRVLVDEIFIELIEIGIVCCRRCGGHRLWGR